MKTKRQKIVRWAVIVAVPLIGFPLLVYAALLVLTSELFMEPIEPLTIDVVDVGGDFYVQRWSVNEDRIDFISDESHESPFLGIRPAYWIGREEDGEFRVRILYTTVEALAESELGHSESFRASLEAATSPETGERFTSFESDYLDPRICVGIDNDYGAAVLFFFEFASESASCSGRTRAALEVHLHAKDGFDTVR